MVKSDSLNMWDSLKMQIPVSFAAFVMLQSLLLVLGAPERSRAPTSQSDQTSLRMLGDDNYEMPPFPGYHWPINDVSTTSKLNGIAGPRRRRSVKAVPSDGPRFSPRHISSKVLVGSPYETKDQASFITTTSIKTSGSSKGSMPIKVTNRD